MDQKREYDDLHDEPPSIRHDVLACLVDGLQFLKSDTAVPAQRLARRVLANIIIEHLDISGFTIQRRNPVRPAPVLALVHSVAANETRPSRV